MVGSGLDFEDGALVGFVVGIFCAGGLEIGLCLSFKGLGLALNGDVRYARPRGALDGSIMIDSCANETI